MNFHARRNLATDARKINGNAFKYIHRDVEQCRSERLGSERERLECRLTWAFFRSGGEGVNRK